MKSFNNYASSTCLFAHSPSDIMINDDMRNGDQQEVVFTVSNLYGAASKCGKLFGLLLNVYLI